MRNKMKKYGERNEKARGELLIQVGQDIVYCDMFPLREIGNLHV